MCMLHQPAQILEGVKSHQTQKPARHIMASGHQASRRLWGHQDHRQVCSVVAPIKKRSMMQ